jgi:hypothetical protein
MSMTDYERELDAKVDSILLAELDAELEEFNRISAKLPESGPQQLLDSLTEHTEQLAAVGENVGKVLKSTVDNKGRAVLTAAAITAGVASLGTTAGASTPTSSATTTITVAKGNTEWGIAQGIAAKSGQNVNTVLGTIKTLNTTVNPTAMPIGSQLIVPAEGNAAIAPAAPEQPENAAPSTTSVTITSGMTEYGEALKIANASHQNVNSVVGTVQTLNANLNPHLLPIGGKLIEPVYGNTAAVTPTPAATPENAANDTTVHLNAGQTIYMYAVPTAQQEGISLTAAEAQIEQTSDIDPANVDRLPEQQPVVVLDSVATAVATQEGAAAIAPAASTPAPTAVAAAAESTYDLIAERGTTYSGIIADAEKDANQTLAQAAGDVEQNQSPTDIGLDSKIPVNNITSAEGVAIQADLDAAANASRPAATMAPEAIPTPAAEAAPASGSAAQLTVEQALQISNNSENSPNPYLEQWAIGSLTQLSQAEGIPLTDTLTQEHVTFLLAWAWVEKGDLDNDGTYNALNTGVDIPALLATANNGSGLQAFVSQQAGETADVDTFLSGFQNRMGRILSDPSSTAEDCISALTWFENTAGNKPWAGMDNPAQGFSQTAYQNTLLSMLAWVRANYVDAGTVPLGTTYDMDKPHVSAGLLQFTGTGPISVDNAAPAPVPDAAPTTTTTVPVAPTPVPTTQSRAPVPSKATPGATTTPAPTTTTPTAPSAPTTTTTETIPQQYTKYPTAPGPGITGSLTPEKQAPAR